MIMSMRLPTSSLFPYTTLFRSDPHILRLPPGISAHHVGVPEQTRAGIDRKSTRLNSSHVEISYAVFCLKKKTETLVGKLIGQVLGDGQAVRSEQHTSELQSPVH